MTDRRLPILLLSLSCLLGQSWAQSRPRSLTRLEAIRLAIDKASGNLQVRESWEEIDRQQARSEQVRSALLPQLSASLRQSSQTNNLEALGLRPEGLFRPPNLVGPFSTFDARLRLQQNLFSLSHWKDLKAAKLGVEREQDEEQEQEDQVATRVSQLYMLALRRQEELKSVESRLQLARELLSLAHHQREVGIGTALDETRANLEVTRTEQERLASQLEARNSLLELKHFLAIDLDTDLQLTDSLDDLSPLNWTPAGALEKALSEREDLQALKTGIRESRAGLGAAKATRLPELQGFAEYGTIGSAISNTIPTWLVGAELQLPLFRGGRTSGEIAERASQLRSREIAASELRRKIELETRTGLDRVNLTEQQVKVAGEAVKLAEDELTRSERRFRAGVSTNLEVIEAQSHLRQVQDARVAALFEHQMARVALAQTLGVILTELP